MRRRVLMVMPECPWPADTGLRNHALGMLRVFARLADVSVFGYARDNREAEDWRRLAEREGFVLDRLVARAGSWRRWKGRLVALSRGFPLSCADFAAPALGAEMRESLARARRSGRPFDLVAFEMFWTLLAAPALDEVPVLLFPVDGYRLYWRRMGQNAAGLADTARSWYLERAFGQLESRHYRRADHIVTVAAADALSIASSCPGANIGVLPVPLPRTPLAAPRRPNGPVRVLVGGHFHTPSIAADARRFLAELKRRPLNGEIVVWGRGARASGVSKAAGGAGARVVEWVDDMAAFRAEASIYVYPQRFACGIQTKIQEAMAAGQCVLAGSDVLGPVGARDGIEGVLSDGPAHAAEALADLLNEPAKAEVIGQRARELALREFSVDAISRRLAGFLGWPAPPPTREEVPSDHLLHC